MRVLLSTLVLEGPQNSDLLGSVQNATQRRRGTSPPQLSGSGFGFCLRGSNVPLPRRLPGAEEDPWGSGTKLARPRTHPLVPGALGRAERSASSASRRSLG